MLFDKMYLVHPDEGVIYVETDARPANASTRKIVERFVWIRDVIDREIEDERKEPKRRYYG